MSDYSLLFTHHSSLAPHSCMIRRLLLCALFASTTAAQAPDADWRTITTKHFRVHYPARYERWATRAASRMESVREAGLAQVGFAPEQDTAVLAGDPLTEPNGETVTVLGQPRIARFCEPPPSHKPIGP